MREIETLMQKKIDTSKLRAAIRRMGKDDVYHLLDRAIDLLSQQGLRRMVKGYLNPEKLEIEDGGKRDLLQEIRDFRDASLGGKYYEPFDVNWKNCSEKSRGTEAWIADFHRHLDGCVKMVKAKVYPAAKEGFAILFSLLRKIDEDQDEILFFADDGGVWEMGIDWRGMLPVWFRCLAAASGPDEYAREVTAAIRAFVHYDQKWFIPAARRAGTPDQRKRLMEIVAAGPESGARSGS